MQTNRHLTPELTIAPQTDADEIAMTQVEPGVWQFLWHEFSAWQEVHVREDTGSGYNASPLTALPPLPQAAKFRADYTFRDAEAWNRPSPVQDQPSNLLIWSRECDLGYLDPCCQALIPTFSVSTPSGLAFGDRPQFNPQLPNFGWRAGVVAGVALAVTTGAIAHLAHQNPDYEGTFQLSVSAPTASASRGISAPTILEPETQIKVMESPRLIDPVVQQLNAQNVDITYTDLTDKLTIAMTEGGIEVQYRDANPETVRRVLDQLSDTYVNYSQECRDRACRGINFIETQLPHVQRQVNTLRDDIQQFRQAHGGRDIQTQSQEFARRTSEITKQGFEVEVQLAEARQQQSLTQQKLSLEPDETIALQLLNREQRYHNLLYQLRSNDQQIATEISQLQVDHTKLQTLYTQHQQLMDQLQQVGHQVLPAYLASPTADLQNPIFQEAIYQGLLQQSIATAQTIQILEIRQETIAQTQTLLNQQQRELASLLRQEAALQQELNTETGIVQQYLDKMVELRSQTTPSIAWQLVSPPEVMESPNLAVVLTSTDAQRQVGVAALLGVLMGVGVATTAVGYSPSPRSKPDRSQPTATTPKTPAPEKPALAPAFA